MQFVSSPLSDDRIPIGYQNRTELLCNTQIKEAINGVFFSLLLQNILCIQLSCQSNIIQTKIHSHTTHLIGLLKIVQRSVDVICLFVISNYMYIICIQNSQQYLNFDIYPLRPAPQRSSFLLH